MKTKKDIFISRVNFEGNLSNGMDSRCWEFVPHNSNYSGKSKLSFNMGNGKIKAIHLCGFYYFTGKFPKMKVYPKCHNPMCVNPSHHIADYGIVYFGEYEREGIRYKPCSKCKNVYPKTKEYFYISGKGIYLTCKKCALEKVKVGRAKHWARVLRNEIFRRHNQNGIEVTIDEEFILELWKRQNGKCYWTGITMVPSPINKYPFQPSLDRLDNTKGYIPDNVVLCCFSINMGRNSVPKEIFEKFILEIKKNGISTKLWK